MFLSKESIEHMNEENHTFNVPGPKEKKSILDYNRMNCKKKQKKINMHCLHCSV